MPILAQSLVIPVHLNREMDSVYTSLFLTENYTVVVEFSL